MMLRHSMLAIGSLVASTLLAGAPQTAWAELSGHYMEARTCQVYTGPCFANAEMGLTGKDAVMAWKIRRGKQADVDLSGLSVVVVLHADQTLGFDGLEDPSDMKAIVLVDQAASEPQREALVRFARTHAGLDEGQLAEVVEAPIRLSLNLADLTGTLSAGNAVQLTTRKARPGDCICMNEIAFYPPLAQVEHCAPGVATQGDIVARALGTSWSIPNSRSAYMATFSYQ